MSENKKIQPGWIFGIGMAAFNFVNDLVKEDEPTPKQILVSFVFALISGAVAGLLFGWLFRKFAHSTWLQKSTQMETGTGEIILFETPANHFKGIEGVGGKLYLTNQRLVFQSHKFNFQNHRWSVSVSDIAKVDRYGTMGFINNGLFVITGNGQTERFVVEQPAEWLKQLVEINGLHTPAS